MWLSHLKVHVLVNSNEPAEEIPYDSEQQNLTSIFKDKHLKHACTCRTAPKCHILKFGPSKFYRNMTLLPFCSPLPGIANIQFDE